MNGTFVRDEVKLAYRDVGDGPPLIFQHGLGATADQPFEIVGELDSFRRITLETRGHGDSDLGPDAHVSIATSVDDLVALMDELSIDQAIVGGMSMGAAISARLARVAPSRISKLILARPAWSFETAPENMRIFGVLADLVAEHGPIKAKVRLQETPQFADLKRSSPHNAASLLGQCDRPRSAHDIAVLLGAIASDGPGLSADDYAQLSMPTLVLGNDHDAVHLLTMAHDIAHAMPDATFSEIPAKSVDRAGYLTALQRAVSDFVHDVGPSMSEVPYG
ncbi:MAG: alpha/beta hydrolase [Pseudomonadota bacterium]